MGDSERAVRKMESSFRMRNISFSVFLTCEMRHYWTYERYQITYSKRITHAVKMVESCSRESGVLCSAVRLWLLGTLRSDNGDGDVGLFYFRLRTAHE